MNLDEMAKKRRVRGESVATKETPMDIYEFAKKLNGREYDFEITREEEKLAKELGFVVVFGVSDDCTEFRGAIDEEISSYNGRTIYLTKTGLLEKCECECAHYKRAKKESVKIKAIWSGGEGYNWTFETELPHATFEITEDGEKYCRGIIFDIKDL